MSNNIAAVDPSEVGFDPSRLTRIETHFAKYIESGKLPGVHVAVTRGGKLAYETKIGYADIEAKKPIADDTIYRI
jgi:CubicO group peptidase (beta-lactamase class C family)